MKEVINNTKEKKLKYKNIYFSIWNILSLSIILGILNNLYFSEEQIVFVPQAIDIFGNNIIFDTYNISMGFLIMNLIIFIFTNIHTFFNIKGLFLSLTVISFPLLPLTIFNIYYMIKNKIV